MKKCLNLILAILLFSCFMPAFSVTKEKLDDTLWHAPLRKLILSSDFKFESDPRQMPIRYKMPENDVFQCIIYADTSFAHPYAFLNYDARCRKLYDVTGGSGALKLLAFDQSLCNTFEKTAKMSGLQCQTFITFPLPFCYADLCNMQYKCNQNKDGCAIYSFLDSYIIKQMYNWNHLIEYPLNFVKIATNKHFDTYLVEMALADGSIIFKLLNTDLQQIRYEQQIASFSYLERSQFTIDEQLKISVTTKPIIFDEAYQKYNYGAETLTANYQICDDGKIVELK